MYLFGARIAIVASAVLGLSVFSAQAEEKASGPYIGLFAIGSSVGDVDFDNDKGSLSAVNTADFDIGYGASLKGGYKFGSMRAEIELGYRKVDINGVSGKSNPSGDVDVLSAIINGAWDFDTGTAAVPYVSLGVGLINVNGDIGYNDSTGRAQLVSFDGTAPAGQFGVGVGYGISPKVDLVGGYSFLAAPTGKTGQDEIIKMHSIQVGLHYKF